MKTSILTLFLTLLLSIGYGQVSKNGSDKPNAKEKVMLVETSCGECNFGLKGKSCDLAVRIDGKSYFVDGATIHDFGNPHGDDGFCNAVRKAEVQGKIVKDRFKATYFKLLPVEKKAGKESKTE